MAPQGDKRDSKRFGQWLEDHDLLCTFCLCLMAGLIGYRLHPGMAALALAGVEFVAGVAWWITRHLFSELDEVAKGLNQQSATLGDVRRALVEQAETIGVVTQLGDARIADDLRRISHDLNQLARNPQLLSMVQQALARTAELSGALAHRTPSAVHIKSESEQMQRAILTYMRGLPDNFTFQAVTPLQFWSDNVTSNPAALLHMNASVAQDQQGAIYRVILIEKAHIELSSNEWDALKMHCDYATSFPGRIDIRVLIVAKPRMATFGHFAICRSAHDRPSLLDVHYGANWKAERLEVVQKQELIDERDEVFRLAYETATPIAEFMTMRPAQVTAAVRDAS